MKTTLITIMLVIGTLLGYSQNVVIHVSESSSLESQLTEEQMLAITTLSITGKLTDNDYTFLRNNFLPQLKTLSLKDADIDTIPAKAFYKYKSSYTDNSNVNCHVILPQKLVFIGDSAFYFSPIDLVITGDFPKRGAKALSYHSVTISEDNKHCKLYKNEFHQPYEYYILSADEKTLYYSGGTMFNVIPEGIETISERAFEYHAITKVYFPQTLKRIDDFAFYNCCVALWDWQFTFLSENPPILGKDVFLFDYDMHGIPDLWILKSWEGKYLEQDAQWAIFKNINMREKLSYPPTSSIDSTPKDCISVISSNSTLLFTAPNAVKLEVYTMDAVKVGEARFVDGKATVKVGEVPATYLYIVTYPDGRRESGKARVSEE